MARTFTKEEFQIALDRALAQKLAEEAGSEEDEEPSQQDDEDDEQIGVAALGLISKKRKARAQLICRRNLRILWLKQQ